MAAVHKVSITRVLGAGEDVALAVAGHVAVGPVAAIVVLGGHRTVTRMLVGRERTALGLEKVLRAVAARGVMLALVDVAVLVDAWRHGTLHRSTIDRIAAAISILSVANTTRLPALPVLEGRIEGPLIAIASVGRVAVVGAHASNTSPVVALVVLHVHPVGVEREGTAWHAGIRAAAVHRVAAEARVRVTVRLGQHATHRIAVLAVVVPVHDRRVAVAGVRVAFVAGARRALLGPHALAVDARTASIATNTA